MACVTILKRPASIAILLAMFVAVVVLFVREDNVRLHGDGKEYVLLTVAFQRHFSFGVTDEDLEQAKKDFPNEAKYLDYEYRFNPDDHFHEYGDAKYSNHYGSYSAMVAMVKFVTDVLGIYPMWAFFVANCLLYFAALLAILLLLRADRFIKVALIVLTAVSPALLYLGWPHGEVYIFAFMVIGLVFHLNGQFGRSIFFMAVAAMQNLGVVPFAMMVGADLLIEKAQTHRRPDGKVDFWASARAAAPYGFCYLPAFIPVFSTYVRFGTPNLVADVAMENKYLISKACAYLFDLNLGILPYEPIILLVFIAMSFYGIKKQPRRTVLHLLGLAGMLYVISNQKDINCGMQNIMRYNVWIVPVLVFFVVPNWGRIFSRRNGLAAVVVSEAVFTMFLLLYIVRGGGAFSYNGFAPWAKLVMDRCPALYNPTHAIFYSRALGVETYYHCAPVICRNEKGHVRKILLNKVSEQEFNSSQWVLKDENGNDADKGDLVKKSVDEGEFWYLNTTRPIYHADHYDLGEPIVFTAEGFNADQYVNRGLSHRERWGTWSYGPELLFAMDTGRTNDTVFLARLQVAGAFQHPRRVAISVFGQKVWAGTIRGRKEIEEIAFPIMSSRKGLVLGNMSIPDVKDGRGLRRAERTEMLGVRLVSMVVEELVKDYPPLPADGKIRFNGRGRNATEYTAFGISSSRRHAAWTDGFASVFSFSSNVTNSDMCVVIDLWQVHDDAQTLEIRVNGNVVFDGRVNSGTEKVAFDVPGSEDGKYRMCLYLPDAAFEPSGPDSSRGNFFGVRLRSVTIRPKSQ